MAEEAYVSEVYSKASCVLHTLRWLIGDEDFYAALYRLLDGQAFAYRTVSTADFRRLVAGVTGRPYDWFFDRYLHEASIPTWRLERTMVADGEVVRLSWDDPLFELPVPVRVAGELHRVEMPGGQGSLRVSAGSEVTVDPDGWLLALPAQAASGEPGLPSLRASQPRATR